jgi:hypothetical protein
VNGPIKMIRRSEECTMYRWTTVNSQRQTGKDAKTLPEKVKNSQALPPSEPWLTPADQSKPPPPHHTHVVVITKLTRVYQHLIFDRFCFCHFFSISIFPDFGFFGNDAKNQQI